MEWFLSIDIVAGILVRCPHTLLLQAKMSLCEKHITDIIFENGNRFLKVVLCFLTFILQKYLLFYWAALKIQ